MKQVNAEIDRNYEAFVASLPELLNSHPGKYALIHGAKVVEFFDTSVAAVIEGMGRFGAGKYSVQEVASDIENLGFYSYAGGSVQA